MTPYFLPPRELIAPLQAAALEGIDVVDPDLTLKGLAILHAEVSGGQPLELGLPT